MSGLVLIDKPSDYTSHDVVARVRKALGTKKVGHAGTLDPMATGLLVLGIDSGTKLLTFLVGLDKSYEATIRLGQATISDDSQSEFTFVAKESELAKISLEQIRAEIEKLTGTISQRPSSVSAIKLQGKRAYDMVRAGEEVSIPKREVSVHSFELMGEPIQGIGFIDLQVRVECSSGTYIRALARDLGESLGVGGHLTALRRTRVGSYPVEEANSIEELKNLKVTPLAEAAKDLFPLFELSDQEVVDLVHGKRIANSGGYTSLVGGLSSDGKLVAVLEPVKSDLKSVVVFQGELND